MSLGISDPNWSQNERFLSDIKKKYFTLMFMKSHSNFTGFKVLILTRNISRNVEKLLELDCILFIIRSNISGKACKSILLLIKGTIFGNKYLKIILIILI